MLKYVTYQNRKLPLIKASLSKTDLIIVWNQNRAFHSSYSRSLLLIDAPREQLHAIHSCQTNPIYHSRTCDGGVSLISFDIAGSTTRRPLSDSLTNELASCARKVSPSVCVSGRILLDKSATAATHAVLLRQQESKRTNNADSLI